MAHIIVLNFSTFKLHDIGSKSSVVVFLLKSNRASGHHADGVEKEEQANHISTLVPPCLDAEHLVVGYDVHSWRTV